MEEFVRKDIEKRRILFLHAETFYIKGRSVFKKRLGLFKGIPELFITSFSGMDFLFHMIQADYWISFFLCPFNQSGHLFGLLFLWS